MTDEIHFLLAVLCCTVYGYKHYYVQCRKTRLTDTVLMHNE